MPVGVDGGLGDRVRLELVEGSGHGARVVLTVTGSDPDDRDRAVDLWVRGAIGHLAARGVDWATSQQTRP